MDISAEGFVMRLNVRYLLDLPREIGGNFGLSRLEWRYLAGFVRGVFQGTRNEYEQEKSKINTQSTTDQD